jgi:hypothetical protein
MERQQAESRLASFAALIQQHEEGGRSSGDCGGGGSGVDGDSGEKDGEEQKVEASEESGESDEESAPLPSLWSRMSQRFDEDRILSTQLSVVRRTTTTNNATATTTIPFEDAATTTTALRVPTPASSSSSLSSSASGQPSGLFACFLPTAQRGGPKANSSTVHASKEQPRRLRAPLRESTNLVLD